MQVLLPEHTGARQLTSWPCCLLADTNKVEIARQQCAQQLSENDMVMKARALATAPRTAAERTHGVALQSALRTCCLPVCTQELEVLEADAKEMSQETI